RAASPSTATTACGASRASRRRRRIRCCPRCSRRSRRRPKRVNEGHMSARLVPFAFAKANSVLPAAEREGRLVLWVTTATPPAAIGEVRRSLGRELEPRLVAQPEFDAALKAAYTEPTSEAASIVDEVQGEAELGRLLQDLPEV